MVIFLNIPSSSILEFIDSLSFENVTFKSGTFDIKSAQNSFIFWNGLEDNEKDFTSLNESYSIWENEGGLFWHYFLLGKKKKK